MQPFLKPQFKPIFYPLNLDPVLSLKNSRKWLNITINLPSGWNRLRGREDFSNTFTSTHARSPARRRARLHRRGSLLNSVSSVPTRRPKGRQSNIQRTQFRFDLIFRDKTERRVDVTHILAHFRPTGVSNRAGAGSGKISGKRTQARALALVRSFSGVQAGWPWMTPTGGCYLLGSGNPKFGGREKEADGKSQVRQCLCFCTADL